MILTHSGYIIIWMIDLSFMENPFQINIETIGINNGFLKQEKVFQKVSFFWGNFLIAKNVYLCPKLKNYYHGLRKIIQQIGRCS